MPITFTPGRRRLLQAASCWPYGDLRSVVEHLQDMKLDASVIDKLAHGNYARVLKRALMG
jgi:hypothetical protein